MAYLLLPSKSVPWFSSYITVYNVKGSKKTIQIVLSPTGVSESISASYDQQTSPGRSAPVISYSSTGARTVSFSMRVSADTLPDAYKVKYKDGTTKERKIKEYIEALKALLYPDYSGSSGAIKSPHCYVSVGGVKLNGVCTSFNASYPEIFTKNGFYSVVDIDLSFMEVLELAPGNTNIVESSTPTGTDRGTIEDISPKLVFQDAKDYKGNNGSKQSKPFMYKQGQTSHWIATPQPYDVCTVDCVLTILRNTKSGGINTLTFDKQDEMWTFLQNPHLVKTAVYKIVYRLHYNGKVVSSQQVTRYLKFM